MASRAPALDWSLDSVLNSESVYNGITFSGNHLSERHALKHQSGANEKENGAARENAGLGGLHEDLLFDGSYAI